MEHGIVNKKTYPDWRENLKRCLKQRGMTASELAEKTGLSNTFISNYIGRRIAPRKNHINISEENFNLIAETLDMHPAELRYGIDFPINIQLFLKCRKSITKAAEIKKQRLTNEQNALSTAILYNRTHRRKTIPPTVVIDIIDIVS